MRFLIDTHVLLWMRREPHRLSQTATDLLKNEQNAVYVSAVSAFEISVKRRIGKLECPEDFLNAFDGNLRRVAFEPLPLTAKHAVLGAGLARDHKDPFDRLLAGQALCEGMTVVSADPVFRAFGLTTVW